VYVYIYINSTNIPPIMIINRIYETQNILSLVSFLVGLSTYQHPSVKYTKDLTFTSACVILLRRVYLNGTEDVRSMTYPQKSTDFRLLVTALCRLLG